jgi:hypothetical protein
MESGLAMATRRALLAGAALIVAGALLIGECASGGGMGAPSRTCDCMGFQWELYDRRPADGPRRTLCLGLVRSTTCYRLPTGPPVDCRRLPR